MTEPSPNTIRAALERLVEAHNAPVQMQFSQWTANLTDAFAAARAALAAEPVGEALSDEELDALERRCWKLDSVVEHEPGQGFQEVFPKEETFDHRAFARAILSRWGSLTVPPAPDHVNLIGFAFGREPWATWLRKGGCLESAHCELSDLMLAAIVRWSRPATPPAPAEGEVQRDAVIAAVTEALGGAYDCLRVWEAWSVGTMGQDDFALVAEDDSRVAEIADAAIAAMRPATPPAPDPGEVGELADRLGWIAAQLGDIGWSDDSASVARTATLLQQLSAPAPVAVPVAVSERLPGEGDCDAEGRCWIYQPWDLQLASPQWTLLRAKYASANYGATYWLPAHAIPLPQAGESEV